MPQPHAPFVLAGDAAQSALLGVALAALKMAQPVLADMQHPADPQAASALEAVNAAIAAHQAHGAAR